MQVKDLTKTGSKFVFDTSEQLTEEGLKRCRLTILPTNSLLMVFDAGPSSVGKMCINIFDLCINNKFWKFSPNLWNWITFSYFFIKQVAEKNFQKINRSTAAWGFGREQFKNFIAKYPKDFSLIYKFNQICEPLFELQKSNELIINKLLKIQRGWIETLD